MIFNFVFFGFKSHITGPGIIVARLAYGADIYQVAVILARQKTVPGDNPRQTLGQFDKYRRYMRVTMKAYSVIETTERPRGYVGSQQVVPAILLAAVL